MLSTRHGSDLVVGALLVATVVFHVAVLVARQSPTGVDFGNWLYFGHQILGSPVGGDGPSTYPPLIPVISVGLTALVGPTWANALVMAFSGVAPAVGLYLTSRMSGVRWSAVPATVLLAVTASTGEPIAWGGAPQLAGLGFAAVAMGFAVRLVHRRRLVTAVALSGCIVGLAVTSHLILAQFALAFVLLGVLLVMLERPDLSRASLRGRNGWLACAAVVMVPLVALVPLYLRLVTTAGGAIDAGGTARGVATFRVFLENLWAVYREAPTVWKALVILAVAAPLATIRLRRSSPLWPVVCASVAAMAVQAFASTEERLVYFAPLAALFALVLCTDAVVRWRPTVRWRRRVRVVSVILAVAVTVYPACRGLEMFGDQVAFYGRFVPRGTIEGLDWVRDHTSEDALVLAAPIDGAPFGWWVQGYARRDTLVASRDRWLNFPSERVRAQQAVGLLTTPEPLEPQTLDAMAAAGVDYLVLPWAWGGLGVDQLEEFRSSFGEAVRFDNDAIVVIEVPR